MVMLVIAAPCRNEARVATADCCTGQRSF